MKLVIARHGETIENRNNFIQGQTQGTLTLKGRIQAKNLAKKLSLIKLKNKPEIIYCSDLNRAYSTALIISKTLNVPLIKSKNLRERNYGIYQNNPSYKINWNNSNNEVYHNRIPKGESIDATITRAKTFISKIKKKKYLTVLIITHGFYSLVLDSVIRKISLKNSIKKGVLMNANYRVYTL